MKQLTDHEVWVIMHRDRCRACGMLMERVELNPAHVFYRCGNPCCEHGSAQEGMPGVMAAVVAVACAALVGLATWGLVAVFG